MIGRLLIIDDEESIRKSFVSLLSDEGHRAEAVATLSQANKSIDSSDIDLILLDLNLKNESGLTLLKELRQRPGAPMVLVVSGQSEIGTALEAVRLGAIDYLEKPVKPEKLITAVNSCLLLATANRHRDLLVDTIDDQSRMIGNSPALKKMHSEIDRIAISDANVLITGENGTGKELAATRLFLQSKRRQKPFLKVNCPGIPTNLFESELFGHKKGAFTGAINDYPGKFVQADSGTLFLDEIGDLPVECQAKLLRVLETGEVTTLGATETRIVNVRTICATNRDLKKLIKEGRFREDLFYRISVLEIKLPSLAERREDIPLLANDFLIRYDPSGQTRLSPDAMAVLTESEFPGNVRQLKNMMERFSILLRGRQIRPEDLTNPAISESHSTPLNDESSLSDRLRRFERSLLEQTLKACDGNIAEAARELKLDRSNLSKKLKDYDLI